MLRIMPFLWLLYIVAYLDRVNVGYAAASMSRDLGMSSSMYGLGAGIFFVGYFLFEVPTAIAASELGVARWIKRIMITWGIAAAALGLVQNAWQFCVLRFILGAAEAGFFPAMLIYLGRWFAGPDRAKAIALFMSATTLALIIGGPMSALLLELRWGGIAGWRWLLVLEGLPAVALGLVVPRLLIETPDQAKWLSPIERRSLKESLQAEACAPTSKKVSPWAALADRKVMLMAAVYFFGLLASNGVNFWLPTIVRSMSGRSGLAVGLIASLPYTLGLFAKLAAGWSSDRTGERRWHTASLLTLGGVGIAFAGLWQRADGIGLALTCVGIIGLLGYTPSFWAHSTKMLAGGASAAGVAVVNSLGNLGSFVGPSVVGVIKDASHSFTVALVALGGAAVAAAALMFFTPRIDAAKLSARKS